MAEAGTKACHGLEEPEAAASAPPLPRPTLGHVKVQRHDSGKYKGDKGDAGTYTRVTFSVTHKAEFGETIHILGDSFALGKYNKHKSIQLFTTPQMYPVWATKEPIILPSRSPTKYLYAIFSSGTFKNWEMAEAERLLVPKDETLVVEDTATFTASALQQVSRRPGTISSPNLLTSQAEKPDSTSVLHAINAKFERNGMILVAFHLPVVMKKHVDGSWSAAWNRDSVIARGTKSLADEIHTKWVGAITRDNCGLDTLTEKDKTEITQRLEELHCTPIFLESSMHDLAYDGFCKTFLWPLMHNVAALDCFGACWNSDSWDPGSKWVHKDFDDWWEAYQQVNGIFATTVAGILQNGDAVWIHNYEMMVLPKLIQELCIENDVMEPSIVFFLHTPFPTSEAFRSMGVGELLLRGVLASSVVGFHVFEHARHFLNACKRQLGVVYQSRQGGNLCLDFERRNILLTVSHVGLDTDYCDEILSNPSVDVESKKIRDQHPGKVIIVGVDSCQRLSGLAAKFLAFEHFLSQFPIWRQKVVLVQRCTMEVSQLKECKYCSNENRQLISRITQAYGDVIDYKEIVGPIPVRDRFALWRASDVYLNTSVREGLNLNPLEYVYTRQDPCGAGVVIMSEFSSSHALLNGAVRCSPWNGNIIASQIDYALTMKKSEREGRTARDLPNIMCITPFDWTVQVIDDMVSSQNTDRESAVLTNMEHVDSDMYHTMRAGDEHDFAEVDNDRLLEAYQSSKRRIFFLDYDGTLVASELEWLYMKTGVEKISADQWQGKLPEQIEQALLKLCASNRDTVFIVSGARQEKLNSALGHITGLGIAAENGGSNSWNVQKKSGVATQGVFSAQVFSATGLHNTQIFGKQDPYVKVTLLSTQAKRSARTKYIASGGTNPAWTSSHGCKLGILLKSMDAPMPDAPLLLQFEVWNANAFKDDLIGRTEVIRFDAYGDDPAAREPRDYVLSTGGTLRCEIDFEPDVPAAPPTPPSAVPRSPTSPTNADAACGRTWRELNFDFDIEGLRRACAPILEQ